MLPLGQQVTRTVLTKAASAAAIVFLVMFLDAPRLAAQPSAAVVGQVQDVVVARGDTWRSIGSRFGVDPAVIARANGMRTSTLLRVGHTLHIDVRHLVPEALQPGTILVNVPQRMLFLGGDTVTRAWPVAVGRRSWPTPLGAFTVVGREQHPTWDVPVSILEEARRAGVILPRSVPPGPDNPLGDYWLGLSLGGVGIHGTNAPSSIYQAVTHGCIRLHPDDIAQLFAVVRVGTRGALIYEPVLVARDGDSVLLEVHPDVYRRAPHDVMQDVRARIAHLDATQQVDWVLVADIIKEHAGVARVITVRPADRHEDD